MNEPLDLESCAREPIHIPGGIQPHGALLALDAESFAIVQASANTTDILHMAAAPSSLADLPPSTPSLHEELRTWLADDEPLFLRSITIGETSFQVSAHLTPQCLLVEFEAVAQSEMERFDRLMPRIRRFLDGIESVTELDQLYREAAAEVRRMTGFNRVLIYRFDEDWNGTVIAEDGDGTLPSYMDLRFPASDIPAQARELYRRNRLRLIPTATYEPVPMVPALPGGDPLDMSMVALRSVSPVHREYMRNMGTEASMSISLLDDGKLWGLISCHHAMVHLVSPQVRAACDFLGRIVAQRIATRERMIEASARLDLKQVETELVARLSQAESYQTGLVNNPRSWLQLTGAEGAAVVSGETVLVAGSTPPSANILALARWLAKRGTEQVFATDRLASLWPEGELITDRASGVIAVPISQIRASFVLWFRPEVVRTVTWSGDPRKSVEPGTDRLHPRQSFEIWKEQVCGRSLPWSRNEVQSAADFRNAIVNFVLRRAEERAELADELERSNKELEAFSYSISHDLRAPFRHIVGYSELLSEREPALDDTSRHYLDSIHGAALSAGQLVDDLLNFSRLGRSQLATSGVDMEKLVAEIRRSVQGDLTGRQVEWTVEPLPPAYGDASLLRQALANLIDNALKYSRHETTACIRIRGKSGDKETVYSVSDNGVGFDMAYVGKLFGVFQRLHRVDEFEGTGIGLALTKRIIDRHGGWIRAEGTLGEGATFTFAIPKR